MYIPVHFQQTDLRAMHALMRAHPFATVVSHNADGVNANHLPMVLAEGGSEYGVLACHLPRANPLSQQLRAGAEVLVIFNGPSAYISPSWYPSKAEAGRVVPTWNYAVVHARGCVKVIDDPAWLATHLAQLTDQQEAAFAHPWALADAPADYSAGLMRALVGVEISISSLQGKWKLSQNRSPADHAGVVRGLQSAGGSAGQQLAAWMQPAP